METEHTLRFLVVCDLLKQLDEIEKEYLGILIERLEQGD